MEKQRKCVGYFYENYKIMIHGGKKENHSEKKF